MFFETFTIPSSACCEQNAAFLLPDEPKDGTFEQSSREHVFFLTFTIPSSACCEQNSQFRLPTNLVDARLEQPS